MVPSATISIGDDSIIFDNLQYFLNQNNSLPKHYLESHPPKAQNGRAGEVAEWSNAAVLKTVDG